MRITDNYEGHRVVHPYTYGVAYHNYYLRSLPETTESHFRVVLVTYSISTFRLFGGDQHPSLFSNGDDALTSGFGGSIIFSASYYTSTKPTSDYVSGIITEFSASELESMFARPGVTYLHPEAGTTSPTEITPRVTLLKSKSIDPETLDDSA